MSELTKAAMPPVAVGVGLAPHFERHMRFLFDLSSVGAAVVGAYTLYIFAGPILYPSTHFATPLIGVLWVIFAFAGITGGLLTALDVYRRFRRRFLRV